MIFWNAFFSDKTKDYKGNTLKSDQTQVDKCIRPFISEHSEKFNALLLKVLC